MTLVARGYSASDVRYGMTIRGYGARLYGTAMATAQRQRENAMAVMFGVGALFAKSGITTLDEKTNELLESMRAELVKMLSNLPTEAPTEQQQQHSPQAGQPRRQAPAPPPKPKQRSAQEVQKDIRRLDALMTKLTGRVVKNPAGGYQRAQAVTAFDVAGTPTVELMRRVE